MEKKSETSIPDEYSLWVRPMRQLLDDGKPVGQITMLTLSRATDGALPFCAVAYTSRNRLIAWPIMPPNPEFVTFPLDHITLEFPSGKMHATGFNANGKREAVSQSWCLQEFQENHLAFWFRLVVRNTLIESQELEVERLMKSPTSDIERRKQEFARYGQSLRIVDVPLPSSEPEGDYILCSFFLADPDDEPKITSDIFLCGGVDEQIEGWAEGTTFEVTGKRLPVGPKHLAIATACPPGQFKQDVAVAFPRTPRP